MKKKKLLPVLAAAVLVCLIGLSFAIVKMQNDQPETIVLLHTNDVHGAIENYAKVAALKKQYEESGSYVLLLDAGDFSQGESAVNESKGETAVELMNLSGYDVATLGNHEFDYGYDNVVKLESEADFPFISANILKDGENAFKDRVIFTTPKGKKIGVFGLDTPETATKTNPDQIKGVTFIGQSDPAELFDCAQEQVDILLSEGCEMVICISHLGIDEESTGYRSIDLLKKVNGIDFLIDGHSHSTLDEIKEVTDGTGKVNGTFITSAGEKMESIGKIVVTDGSVAEISNLSTEELEVEPDAEVSRRAGEIISQIEQEYGEVIGSAEVALKGEKEDVRTAEAGIGNLVADAMLWEIRKNGVDCDLAIMNGGSIRDSIPEGDITKNDIHTVLPYGNELCVVQVTGEELLEVLEASTYCIPQAIGGFPQVSGIEFTVDSGKIFHGEDNYPDSTYSKPSSINRVSIQSAGGKPFDRNKVYSVGINDFMASGGDTYYVFKVADSNINLGMHLDEAVMDYIEEELHGVIPADRYGSPEGRIHLTGN